MAIATGQITIKDFNDVTISGSAPSNPALNQLWFDISPLSAIPSGPAVMKMWNGTSWASGNITAQEYQDLLSTISGTEDFITPGAPTNLPIPTGVTFVSNNNASCDAVVTWDTYVQGAIKADKILVIWKKSSTPLTGRPTLLDNVEITTVNEDGASYFVLPGINPTDHYSFGLAAARQSKNGVEVTGIVSVDGVTATFTRASNATKFDGTSLTANQPRYESGKVGKAIMLEEGTTNALTSTVSRMTSGWVSQYSSNDASKSGIALNSGGEEKAVMNIISAITSWTDIRYNLTNASAYGGQSWTLSFGELTVTGLTSGGFALQIEDYDGTTYRSSSTNINANGTYTDKFITRTFTNPMTSGWIGIRALAGTNAGATITIKRAQFEQKLYPTSWIDGTRPSEALAIPGSMVPLSEGTICGWMKKKTTYNAGYGYNLFAHRSTTYKDYIIVQKAAGGSWRLLMTSNAQTDGTAGTNRKEFYVADTTAANSWVHFAVRWSSTEAAMFINNTKIGTITNPPIPTVAGSQAYIGSWGYDTGAYPIGGLLDSFFMFDRALTDAEISAMYGATDPNIDSDTVLKLNFDDNLTQIDMQDIEGTTPNYTGTIGGVDSGKWWSQTKPNGTIVPGTATFSANGNGSVDITIPWTYTPGTTYASDGFYIVYETSNATPTVVPSLTSATLTQSINARSFTLVGVNGVNYHSFKICEYRNTGTGPVTGDLATGSNWTNYRPWTALPAWQSGIVNTTLQQPPNAGLVLAGDGIGYYNSGWKSYIGSDGKFAFQGDANHYITWNGTDLDIRGTLHAGDITSGGTLTGQSIVGGSINIGNGNFTVDNTGALIAKNVTVNGGISQTFTINNPSFSISLPSLNPLIITRGTNGGTWDGCWSNEAYANGAYTYYELGYAGNGNMAIGFSTNPNTQLPSNIDYGWSTTTTGAQAIEAGVTISTVYGSGTTVGTKFEVRYDGADVKWYMDGVLQRTKTAIGSKTFYFHAVLGTGSQARNVKFTSPAMTYIDQNGVYTGTLKADQIIGGTVTASQYIAVGGITIASGTQGTNNGYIGSGKITYADTNTGFWLGNVNGNPSFKLYKDATNYLAWDALTGLDVRGTIHADDIDTGTLDASKITVSNLSASSINTGTLDASKITVSNLSASSITTGTLDASKMTVSNFSGNNITAGTISVEKLSTSAGGPFFSETWATSASLSSWTNKSGNGEVTWNASGGYDGGPYVTFGNNAGTDDMAWFIYNTNIPFDPTKLYRLRVTARRTAGAGNIYFGWIGVQADGVTVVSSTGSTSSTGIIGSSHYHAAYASAIGNTWKEYVGYTKGYGATNGTTGWSGQGCPITLPGQMHPTVKYLRPLIVVNHPSVIGSTDIESFIVEIVPNNQTRIDENGIYIGAGSVAAPNPTWNVTGNCSVVTPSYFKKVNVTTNTWGDAQVYSSEGYKTCYLSFTVPTSSPCGVICGLNTDPATDATYTGIDYAWYPTTYGTAYIEENGVANPGGATQASGAGTYTALAYTKDTVLTITYDGIHVKYYQDGSLRRTVYDPGKTFYFDSSFYTSNSAVANVKFGEGLPSNTLITSGGIYTGSITADQITAGTIRGRHIFSGLFGSRGTYVTAFYDGATATGVISVDNTSDFVVGQALWYGTVGGWVKLIIQAKTANTLTCLDPVYNALVNYSIPAGTFFIPVDTTGAFFIDSMYNTFGIVTSTQGSITAGAQGGWISVQAKGSNTGIAAYAENNYAGYFSTNGNSSALYGVSSGTGDGIMCVANGNGYAINAQAGLTKEAGFFLGNGTVAPLRLYCTAVTLPTVKNDGSMVYYRGTGAGGGGLYISDGTYWHKVTTSGNYT